MGGDGDHRGSKRKLNDKRKYFAGKKRQRSNQLEPGIVGFLVTCNFNEKRCLNECYDLLNHYAHKLGLVRGGENDDETQSNGSDKEEDDFEAAFAKEVQDIKDKAPNKDRDFQQVVTNVKNVLFIRSKFDVVGNLSLMDAILRDLKSGVQKGSRNIMRMTPILGTCKVDQEKLTQLASQCLRPFFGNDDDDDKSAHPVESSQVTSPKCKKDEDQKDADGDVELDNGDVQEKESDKTSNATNKLPDDDRNGDDVVVKVSSDGLHTATSSASSSTPPTSVTATLTPSTSSSAPSATPSSTPRARTFNVEFKSRHNASLDRHSVLRRISEVVQNMDVVDRAEGRNRVDYDQPDFTVAVDVVGKIVCLALLKDYKGNKKYNLQMLGGGGGGGGGAAKSVSSDCKKTADGESVGCDDNVISENTDNDTKSRDDDVKDEFGFSKTEVASIAVEKEESEKDG